MERHQLGSGSRELFPREVTSRSGLLRNFGIRRGGSNTASANAFLNDETGFLAAAQLPGNKRCSRARIPRPASVVSIVIISPTRANCQNDI